MPVEPHAVLPPGPRANLCSVKGRDAWERPRTHDPRAADLALQPQPRPYPSLQLQYAPNESVPTARPRPDLCRALAARATVFSKAVSGPVPTLRSTSPGSLLATGPEHLMPPRWGLWRSIPLGAPDPRGEGADPDGTRGPATRGWVQGLPSSGPPTGFPLLLLQTGAPERCWRVRAPGPV